MLKEGAIAAGLTALMILLFLGSWRSTLIVATSIPLSILTSIIVLWAMGQSLNTMTLGGMALAVGILVDDATVELENVHRNLGMKKPIRRAILDGAAQIAVPAFVSTWPSASSSCRCVFLTGPAASLFYPAGPGRRLRHAGLVLPVADAGADDGAVPAADRSARSTPEGEQGNNGTTA